MEDKLNPSSEVAKEALTPEQIKEMEEKGVEQVLQAVLKNRVEGLKKFEENLETLKGTHFLSEATEDSLRGLVRALDNNFTALNSLNQFVDMMRHDMMSVMQAGQQQGVALWQTSMQMQVLVTLLLKKKIISETQLQKEREKINDLIKENMNK